MKSTLNESIRWMISRDYPEVCEIDDCGYVDSWSESDFRRVHKRRSVIGVVVTNGVNRVTGYCVYELQPNQVEIIRCAVDPRQRRRGIASAMLTRLKEKLCVGSRCGIAVEVDGHSVFAQYCLRNNGFVGHPMQGADRILFLWEKGQ